MTQLPPVASPTHSVPALPDASRAVTDLERSGFMRVGNWRLTAAGDGIVLDGKAERIAGVYAYVVDGVIHYVGSAQRGLHTRFRRYVTSQTMRTSMRIRGEIVGFLAQGRIVEVFVLSPPAFEWRGLPVDLVAGLEEGLIRSMRPIGNRRGNRASH